MKRHILIIVILAFISISLYSQENAISLSGGYTFANIDDSDATADGWRINGLYEYIPTGGPWAYGFSIGYMSLSRDKGTNTDTISYKISTVPIYFAPKYVMGKGKFKGYIKAVLGMQSSKIEREGSVLILEDSDLGFYGGGGLGATYPITEIVYINAEYELAWMSNSFYKDGLTNSVLVGIGVKF